MRRITTFFGKGETENTVDNDTSDIVCGQAAFETYIITNFAENYDIHHPKEITTTLPPYKRLRKLGFKEYRSTRRFLAKKVDSDDMNWFRDATDNSSHGGVEEEEVFFFAPLSNAYQRI